ncbi:2,3-butanediol dehydrogenase [soil metagenome]
MPPPTPVLRLHAAGDVRLHAEPVPVPEPGQALVRITAVGLCGSDRHWYAEGSTGTAGLTRPLVLGHEMGGLITSGPRSGTRVAVEPADPCGHCPPCRAGHANLCPDVRFAGHSITDGGLRSIMAWPERLLMPVPDSIDPDDVSLLEPLGIALHAVDLGHVRAGMSAGVFGCGPVGLLLIRALRAAGVDPILATDRLPHRVAAALASGAKEARLAGEDGQPEGVDAWGPVDVAFEAAGVDEALETALRMVRIGGRVVVVGIPSTPRTSVWAALAREKGLTLAFSRRMKSQHMLRAIELVDQGAVDLSGIITSRLALVDGRATLAELAARSGLKIVVRPSA